MTDNDGQQPACGIRHAWIDAAGTTLHYAVAGAGPAMVLVHGQGESWTTWQQVLPALARTHRVYALDLPGAGRSERFAAAAAPPSRYSDVLAGFLDALDLDRVTLVGNSHGGHVSLRVALAAPERVAALCLVDSSALGREVNPLLMALALPFAGEAMSAWCSTPWGAAQWSWLLGSVAFSRPHRAPVSWYEDTARLARMPGHMIGGVVVPARGQIGLDGQHEILLDELPRLGMPTLVVWGEHDHVLPPRHGAEAASRLPHGKLVVIPGCGHLPQVEQPEAFLAALTAFLASVPEARAAA